MVCVVDATVVGAVVGVVDGIVVGAAFGVVVLVGLVGVAAVVVVGAQMIVAGVRDVGEDSLSLTIFFSLDWYIDVYASRVNQVADQDQKFLCAVRIGGR